MEPQLEMAAGSATRVFRRARPDDAVDVALETFMGDERVDMQTLAAQLDISPATLYRWFGSRAQLLDRVCGRITEQFADAALEATRGEGDERVCEFARHIMVASSTASPIRSFVTREQQTALRLLLRRDSAVHQVLTERTQGLIAETRGEIPPELEGASHLIVQVSTAMIWATFLVGDEPEPDTAVELIRMILAASGD
jgi:AcrR family transcriptional regulator